MPNHALHLEHCVIHQDLTNTDESDGMTKGAYSHVIIVSPLLSYNGSFGLSHWYEGSYVNISAFHKFLKSGAGRGTEARKANS